MSRSDLNEWGMEDEGENEEPRFLEDPKRLAQTAVIVAAGRLRDLPPDPPDRRVR